MGAGGLQLVSRRCSVKCIIYASGAFEEERFVMAFLYGEEEIKFVLMV